MKTIAGIAFGFALTPALIGLMALFIWTKWRLDLASADVTLGYALGFATLVVLAGVGAAVART